MKGESPELQVQYQSELANQYERIERRSDRKYLFVPTVKKVIGDVGNKRIFDFATGRGYWARLFKDWGAREVVGVEAQSEMVRLAQQQELNQQHYISYRHADVRDFRDSNPAEVVFAGFLLNYAKSEGDLKAMGNSIFLNLIRGGRFVSLTPNPDKPEFDGSKYGCSLVARQGLIEGHPITCTCWEESGDRIEFNYYWWQKETIENALIAAGMRDIQWHPLNVSEDGKNNFPEDYWKEYIEVSNPLVLECRK